MIRVFCKWVIRESTFGWVLRDKSNYFSTNVMTFFWLIGKVVRYSPWPITICTDSQTSQSGLNENSCTWHQAPENTCQQVTIGFGFTSDWLKKWHDLLPSQSQHTQTIICTNNNSEKTYEVGVSAKRGKMHMAKLRFARVSTRVRSKIWGESITA